MMEHFGEKTMKALAQQKKLDGIDIRKLKSGVKVYVVTRNSLYVLETTHIPGTVIAQGGKGSIRQAKQVYFAGSTFGGSMLALGWIGFGMNMEFTVAPRRILRTSATLAARLVGEDWEFDMEW